MASYVLYGFDTAGTLAEETDQPRRRAPWAILQALAAAAAGRRAADPLRHPRRQRPGPPRAGPDRGGLPFLVKDVLGAQLGRPVPGRRDLRRVRLRPGRPRRRRSGSCSRWPATTTSRSPHALGHVARGRRPRSCPPLVVGVLAAAILVVNINLPNVIETLCSVAIVWANLAYLLVTLPLLLVAARRRGGRPDRGRSDRLDGTAAGRRGRAALFLAGPLGPAGQRDRGRLGPLRRHQHRLAARRRSTAPDRWSRFAAPAGDPRLDRRRRALLSCSVQRRRTGILSEHAAADILDQSRSSDIERIRRSKAAGSAGSHPVNERRTALWHENQRIGPSSGSPATSRRAMVKLQVRKRRKTPQPARAGRPAGPLEKFLGWCVHGYTALGLVAAGLIAVLLVRGGAGAFRWSFLLMVAATIVDSTDGTLARKVRIKEVVPSFDGRRLDDIVDFLTYTFLPLLLIWRAGILPAGYRRPGSSCRSWPASTASARSRPRPTTAISSGFPSLWNVVALYLYALPLGQWAVAGDRDRAGHPDLRADPPSLSVAAGQVQPRASSLLGIPWTIAVRLAHLEAARRRPATLDRDDPASGLDLADLSHALPGRLVGDQRGALAEAHAGRGSRREPAMQSSAPRAHRPGGLVLGPRQRAGLPATSTKASKHPADDEEGDDRQDRPSARSGHEVDQREDRRPEDAGEFLGDAEEPEELARLVPRDQAGEQRAAQRLRPPLHRPDQDRQDQEMGARSS